jgi:hypothetical protein
MHRETSLRPAGVLHLSPYLGGPVDDDVEPRTLPLGQAEVEDLHHAIAGDLDVRGFRSR